MAWRPALRRLSRQLTPPTGLRVITYRTGTVATVTAGASADGVAAVSVTIGPDTIPAPYMSAYAPVVGDMVAVLLIDGAPLILGHTIGLPNF